MLPLIFPHGRVTHILLYSSVELPVLSTAYKLNHTIFCSFVSVYFTQRIIFRAHSCCTVYQNPISFFRMHNISLFVYATFCVYIHLSVDIWVTLPLGYCEECCCEHDCIDISFRLCFQFFWINTRNGTNGSYSSSVFNFLKKCHTLCLVLHHMI